MRESACTVDEKSMVDATRDFTMQMYFYSNACHVCRAYGRDVKLKRCSGCGMIAYCGREHQKKHWPWHKDLCRILADILRRGGTIFGAWNKCDDSDEAWTRTKMNLILLIQIKLGRKLMPYEEEMIQFPRSCVVCHETDSPRLVDCSECPVASFCLDHHRDDNQHAAKCETSRLCFDVDTTRREVAEPIFPENIGDAMPNNMNDLLKTYFLPCTKSLSLKFWTAVISEYLTRPCTFLYAMERLNAPESTSMVIHAIGANAIERESMAYWEILLHRLGSLSELKIILVGPELECDDYEMELCEHCTAAKSRIFVEIIPNFYTDYATGKSFVKPDYVVGFNLGIHECESSERDTWAPSIEELAKQICPFFVTSYTLEESEKEIEKLNRVLDRNVKFSFTGKNPFSSLRPYRDFESEDFFYQNQFLTIYEKLL